MKIFHICLTSRQKRYFFIFRFINFDDFLTAFVKNLMKRPSVFMIDIKSSYKLLLSHKDLRSRNIWQWNDGLKNLYGNTSSLFVFIKRKKLLQHDIKMIHIKCIAIIPFNENWSSFKRPFWNKGPSNMVSHFFSIFFTFSCLYGIFTENFMKKLSLFNINKFLKLILRSTILPSFTILNLLLLKWWSFQYNTKFGKKMYLLIFLSGFY